MEDVLPLPMTLAILAASVAVGVLLLWLERRPREFGKVRLVPTTPLLFLVLVVVMLMGAHLLTLVGASPQQRSY